MEAPSVPRNVRETSSAFSWREYWFSTDFALSVNYFGGFFSFFEFRHLPVYIVAFGTMKYHVISRPGHRSSSSSSRVQPFCFVFLFSALPLLLYKLAGPRRESNDDLLLVIVFIDRDNRQIIPIIFIIAITVLWARDFMTNFYKVFKFFYIY